MSKAPMPMLSEDAAERVERLVSHHGPTVDARAASVAAVGGMVLSISSNDLRIAIEEAVEDVAPLQCAGIDVRSSLSPNSSVAKSTPVNARPRSVSTSKRPLRL
jgi:hypothetical protein